MGNTAGACTDGTASSLDRSSSLIMHTLPTDAEIDAYATAIKQQCKAKCETQGERFERYMASLKPGEKVLKDCYNGLLEELHVGINCHRRHPSEFHPDECSLKMLDSFVPRLPDGSEGGVFYALDFGGSNFRILRCSIKNGAVKTQAKKASLEDCKTDLPKGLLDPKATATLMFDFFASIAEEFLKENGDINASEPFKLGFTFSYPCISKQLDSASLVTWTKGFETGRQTDDPVEGQDVGELMNLAFARKNLPLKVTCVANDTVGTLLSCAMHQEKSLPPCAIGMILGTGMNACYVDPSAYEYGYVGKIINIESGNFNRLLPRTSIDYGIDFYDVGGRGLQNLEKLVSGGYLGEICRGVFLKVFQSRAPSKMFIQNTFGAGDAATCIGDKSSELIVVQRKCSEIWDMDFTVEDRKQIQQICRCVYERAAALSAVLIAACATKSGRLRAAVNGLTCGIDGSVWKCNHFFQDDVRKYLAMILGDSQASLIHCISADDGSGVGAAILAAM